MTQPRPDTSAAEARRWMGEADEELRIARYLIRDETLPARAACFHAPTIDQQRFMGDDLDELNPWTIEGRYPADLGDVARRHITTLLEAADRVVRAARTEIDETD